MIKVIILGITGSIGTNSLNGISSLKNNIKIIGVSAHNHLDKAIKICQDYNINSLCYEDFNSNEKTCLKNTNNNTDIKLYNSVIDMLSFLKPDVIINGISSAAGLNATIKCFQSNLKEDTILALANKESIVIGGFNLFKESKKKKIRIIPVDSEHSCLYELIKAHKRKYIDKLIITASGGPFLNWDIKDLSKIQISDALNHPTWNMGKKITIDSSTLANKGLEVIEAHYLFNFNSDKINVVINPNSIVHSMVLCKNGQIYAQLSPPSMIFPILNAISEKDKTLKTINFSKPLDFSDGINLNFSNVDLIKFPLLKVAYSTIENDQPNNLKPLIFCCADEIAVELFLDNKISYLEISKYIEKALKINFMTKKRTLYDLFDTYNEVKKIICSSISLPLSV